MKMPSSALLIVSCAILLSSGCRKKRADQSKHSADQQQLFAQPTLDEIRGVSIGQQDRSRKRSVVVKKKSVRSVQDIEAKYPDLVIPLGAKIQKISEDSVAQQLQLSYRCLGWTQQQLEQFYATQMVTMGWEITDEYISRAITRYHKHDRFCHIEMVKKGVQEMVVLITIGDDRIA